MRNKLIGIMMAVVLLGSLVFGAALVNADAPVLDHVQITPSSTSVLLGGTQQFSAQGYDSSNVTVPGLTYFWAVVAGGGNINASGLFTAGNVTATYTNTVQVLAVQGTTARIAFATVSVTPPGTPPAPPPLLNEIEKLVSLLARSVKGIPFENLLGAQWTVKYNGTAYTVKATPGVINALSGTSLTLLPNGQTQTTNFTLPSGTTILPRGTVLGVNDRVVVVTVNDQVWLVLKIGTPSPEPRMPPGLKKNDKSDRFDDRPMPPGWQKGKKTGWDKGDRNDDDKNNDDD